MFDWVLNTPLNLLRVIEKGRLGRPSCRSASIASFKGTLMQI